MKKKLLFLNFILMLSLTGCGETLGKMMMKTGMVPNMKIQQDPKKVKKRLEAVENDTIVKSKLKPIPVKKVLVFRESKTPQFCADIGWIIVKDMNGFNIPVKKKIGLFTQTVIVNNDIDAVKKKAAKLGIEAINIYDDISNFEQLVQYIAPYKKILYMISPHKIVGTLYTYERCSIEAENNCKKLLKDKKIPKDIRNIKYQQCLLECSWNEHKKFKSSKEILYGVRAWICDKNAIKKIRNGQTILSLNLEYKVNKALLKLLEKPKRNKNVKKLEIFKF